MADSNGTLKPIINETLAARQSAAWFTLLLLRSLPLSHDFEEAQLSANLAIDACPVPPPEITAMFAVDGSEEKPPHDYSSTQFNIIDAGYSRSQGSPLTRLKAMAANIADEDLAEDGREESPHVTIKYGLHTDKADDVAKIVKDFGGVQIILGKTFIFPAKEPDAQRGGVAYDVVNVAVEGEDIHRLNKLIADSLPHTDTHPKYVPHVCLAYVKPGKGEKYVGWNDVEGDKLNFTELVFSSKNREKTECKLSLWTIQDGDADATFAFDIFNRAAQGVLNRAMKASSKLSTEAKRALKAALNLETPQEMGRAVVAFLTKYRVQLANLLSTTQLAAVLEGAKEVASKIPPIPPMGFDAPLPPTLEPEQAKDLLDTLKAKPEPERALDIYRLPPDQQTYVLQALRTSAMQPPPPSPPITPTAPAGEEDSIQWPVIDEAVKELSEKNVLTRPQFDALDNAARAKAFTVAGIESMDLLKEIRDSLAESVAEGVDYATWREKAMAAVDESNYLSEGHRENVYRTNIQGAFSDGQAAVLRNPFVRSGFPYCKISPINDDRVRHDHLEIGRSGIQGTGYFRCNDPVFLTFRPPWSYLCRCSWWPVSVRHAAEVGGLEEAKQWLREGIEPSPPAFVPMPPFAPPPGFQRQITSAPLSIRLSLISAQEFVGAGFACERVQE